MFEPVVVVSKCSPSIIWGVGIDALHLSGKVSFKSFEREKIVSMDQEIIKNIPLPADGRVIRQPLILNQDARLQSGPMLLSDPR